MIYQLSIKLNILPERKIFVLLMAILESPLTLFSLKSDFFVIPDPRSLRACSNDPASRHLTCRKKAGFRLAPRPLQGMAGMTAHHFNFQMIIGTEDIGLTNFSLLDRKQAVTKF